MRATIGLPGAMDAKVHPLTDADKAVGTLAVVEPRRFSKAQRKIPVFPFCVKNDVGAVVDQGYFVFDVSKKEMTVEHRVEEVPLDLVEEPKEVKK